MLVDNDLRNDVEAETKAKANVDKDMGRECASIEHEYFVSYFLLGEEFFSRDQMCVKLDIRLILHVIR